MNKQIKPKDCSHKDGWMDRHNLYIDQQNIIADAVIYGDSIICHHDWSKSFQRAILNFGIPGDKIENVLWRLCFGKIPKHVSLVIVAVGTNNIAIKRSSISRNVQGMKQIIQTIQGFRQDVDIIVTGIYPRLDIDLSRIEDLNGKLKEMIKDFNKTYFVCPDINDWKVAGKLNKDLFRDDVHLSVPGYDKVVAHIFNMSLFTSTPLHPKEKTDCASHLALMRLEDISGTQESTSRLWNPLYPPISDNYVYRPPKNGRRRRGRGY